MALEVRTIRDAARPAMLIADRRLWLTADRAHVVEDGDQQAAYLLAGLGSEIPPGEVPRLDLGVVEGRIVVLSRLEPETKARPARPNKARRKGEDK